MPRKAIDLTGHKLAHMVVLKRVANDHRNKPRWLVRCDCGNERELSSSHILNGTTRSCGCMKSSLIQQAKTRHGQAPKTSKRSREYTCWLAMRNRCNNAGSGSYDRYGGRGIRVCERWNSSFEAFLQDMGPAPTQAHTVDRLDANLDYGPGNCRWATTLEQLENRRHGLTSEDVRYIRAHPDASLKELSERFNVTKTAICYVRKGRTWQHVE